MGANPPVSPTGARVLLVGYLAIALMAFAATLVLSKPASMLAATCVFSVQVVLMLSWAAIGRSATVGVFAIATKQRESLRNRIDRQLRRSGMGGLASKSMEQAEYSYQIANRRSIYKKMDYILWITRVRYIPKECSISECANGCPVLDDGSLHEPKSEIHSHGGKQRESAAMETNWKACFAELNVLIRHDDSLNWQKFHYVLLLFGAMLTAFVYNFSQPTGNPILCIVLGLVGVFLSWGADLTFQEGLRCLRAHRRKHAMLEQQAPPYNVSFVFEGSAFNHRDVLEAGPLLILTLSLCLIVIAFLQLVN